MGLVGKVFGHPSVTVTTSRSVSQHSITDQYGNQQPEPDLTEHKTVVTKPKKDNEPEDQY